MRIAGAVIALLVAVAAEGVTVAPGDIALAPNLFCGIAACPPSPPAALFGSNLQLKQPLDRYQFVAFGPNGHLFGVTVSGTFVEHDSSLNIVRTIHISGIQGLTVGANGKIYVASYTSGTAGTLTILSPAGAVEQTYSLSGIPWLDAIDLAPDQCTLFWIDNASHGHRFDACSGHALSDLAPGPWAAVRALSDGGYVVGDFGRLAAFDANDHLLAESFIGAWYVTSLAFDADPRFLWIATGGAVTLKYRFADGVIAGSLHNSAQNVAVYGEQRPAAAAAAVAAPALSPPFLFALALGITALAWERLRA